MQGGVKPKVPGKRTANVNGRALKERLQRWGPGRDVNEGQKTRRGGAEATAAPAVWDFQLPKRV